MQSELDVDSKGPAIKFSSPDIDLLSEIEVQPELLGTLVDLTNTSPPLICLSSPGHLVSPTTTSTPWLVTRSISPTQADAEPANVNKLADVERGLLAIITQF